jgi:hypothetical protein
MFKQFLQVPMQQEDICGVVFEVLVAGTMKGTISCVQTPCSIEKALHFRGIYHLLLQGHARNQQELVVNQAGFLFGLVFHPEDGSDLFLQNVGPCVNYVVLNPGKLYSSFLVIHISRYFYIMRLPLGLHERIMGPHCKMAPN